MLFRHERSARFGRALVTAQNASRPPSMNRDDKSR